MTCGQQRCRWSFYAKVCRSEFPAQVWLLNKQGSKIPIEGSITPITGKKGQVIGEVFAFRDISDRKAVQESLIDSEMRFRLLAENSQDLIALIQPNGVIGYASPSHEYILGLNPGNLVKRKIFDLLYPDEIESLQRAVKQVYSENTIRTLNLN